MLLNHNVPIPSAAVALHGYTQEFLRRNGVDPLRAHASFKDFSGDLPIVTHNLSFDWNRALYPEWARLGLPPIGRRGFCTLMLSRRLVDETKSYSLDALRRTFESAAIFRIAPLLTSTPWSHYSGRCFGLGWRTQGSHFLRQCPGVLLQDTSGEVLVCGKIERPEI